MFAFEVKILLDNIQAMNQKDSRKQFSFDLTNYIEKSIKDEFFNQMGQQNLSKIEQQALWEQFSKSAAFFSIINPFFIEETLKNSFDASATRVDICIHVNENGVLCTLVDNGHGITKGKLYDVLNTHLEEKQDKPWVNYRNDILKAGRFQSDKLNESKVDGKKITGGAGKGLEQATDSIAISNGELHITNTDHLHQLGLEDITNIQGRGAAIIVSSPLFDRKTLLDTINQNKPDGKGKDLHGTGQELFSFMQKNRIDYKPASNNVLESSTTYLRYINKITKQELDNDEDENMERENILRISTDNIHKNKLISVSTVAAPNPFPRDIPVAHNTFYSTNYDSISNENVSPTELKNEKPKTTKSTMTLFSQLDSDDDSESYEKKPQAKQKNKDNDSGSEDEPFHITTPKSKK